MKIKAFALAALFALLCTGCACTDGTESPSANPTVKPTPTRAAETPAPTETSGMEDLIPSPNVTTSPSADETGGLLPDMTDMPDASMLPDGSILPDLSAMPSET